MNARSSKQRGVFRKAAEEPFDEWIILKTLWIYNRMTTVIMELFARNEFISSPAEIDVLTPLLWDRFFRYIKEN